MDSCPSYGLRLHVGDAVGTSVGGTPVAVGDLDGVLVGVLVGGLIGELVGGLVGASVLSLHMGSLDVPTLQYSQRVAGSVV